MKISFVMMTSICALLLTTVSMKAQRFKKIKGEGEVVTQDRKVGSFDEIHTHGSFDISITDATSQSVRVEAQANLQEYIEVETSGNELHIRNKNGFDLNSDKSIKIYVSAPEIKGVYCSGSGNINSENQLAGSDNFVIKSEGSGNINLDVQTTSLRSSIAGSGNVTLKGKTTEFEGKISGSGNIRAKEFQSVNTSVKISGSGNAEVVASQKLDTKIAGSGDVKYWGDASVDSKIVGSGGVHKQN